MSNSAVSSDSSDLPSATQPAADTDILLQVRDLTFRIDGRTLWHNFGLTLHAADRLGITGPSGSGKTLLLRTLAGLEPLQSGELVFNGRALADWSMPAYRSFVVYVPQRPAWREGTVDAALRAPFAFQVRRGLEFPDDQARELLRATGRDERFLRQRAERLSGGEAQIVAVVRALLVAPSVLLLDEPTASLDRETVCAIENLITHWISAAPDRGLIWTSHDRAQLERIGNRVLTLGSAT
ncbi:MAG TPA: ATP-binding cassette domain-containing protein [Rudaea sp.]|nr:ATP-binding cassette domain-containing protein [Rudaea sp.]